ncbi:TRAP-type C4-dicarboxylate transport system, small permease component [Desulforamulus putei DSM 12395]|uniref:TRAP-type C4-dicarboxylate transport system, small permease component n=1 Tax=Desulforamulus putei DSM 12395 TaxID=1121429 RepID=A0A1M5BZ45_9FIRM|nr:TRAP transporter small permease [Desulforamulus putei]SHF47705.1 TRAP-type C4-dicarboxylate transport system, small permease component [Desulforamulus putei DSM 12395]
MGLLRKIDKHLEEYLLSFLLSTTVILIAVQVFMRYVMHASPSWTEELARYLFIWMVYIGISYGVKMQRHIKVDAIMLILPFKAQKYLLIFSNILFIVFCVFIIQQGTAVAMNLLSFGQTSPALSIPMGYIYMASPIGFSLAIIRLVQNIVVIVSELKGLNQENNIVGSTIRTSDSR